MTWVEYLEQVRQKPEEERWTILWVVMAVLMLIVLTVWFLTWNFSVTPESAPAPAQDAVEVTEEAPSTWQEGLTNIKLRINTGWKNLIKTK